MDFIDYVILRDYAQMVLNASINEFCTEFNCDFSINEKLYKYENSVFNLNSETNLLLKNKIEYNKFLQLIDTNAPINLKWLKCIAGDNEYSREKTGYRFPIEKVVIVEGITEEILLPAFAEKCNYNFNKKGYKLFLPEERIKLSNCSIHLPNNLKYQYLSCWIVMQRKITSKLS